MNNVQNISFTFTTDIAQFITKSKIEYDRNTRFRPTMKAITETEEKYQAFLEECRQELENLREQYCSGMLAYAFVRLLHDKYKPEENKDGTCTILEKKVHLCNINRPSDIVDEDRKIYAEILTSIVTENWGKEQGRKWKPIFKKLMSDNEEYLTLTPVNRKEIEEACIALKWKSDDLDFLLLRLGDAGIQGNSLHDMLVRFVLDSEGASFEHYEKLQERCETFTPENSIVKTDYKAGETKVTYKRLEAIIKDSTLTIDEKIEQYAAELEKYAVIFQGRSKTARNTLEHMLLLTAHGLGWKIEEVETYLKDFLDPQKKNVTLIESDRGATLSNTILFDYSKVILGCKIKPLSEENRKQLVQAVLSHYANTDSDIFKEEIAFAPSVYDPRLSYPSAEATRAGVEFFKAPLTRRFELLLRGEEQIKKQDMLFALYLLCAKVSKVKDPGKYYLDFEKTANAVLTHCNLPKWYAPHVLEYTIGKAIFGGRNRFEDIFGDITEAYQLINGTEVPNVDIKKENEEITGKTKLSLFSDAFDKTTDEIKKWSQKVTTKTKINLPGLDEQAALTEDRDVTIYKANKAIYANLSKIATEICTIWKNTGWLGMHIVFPGMSRSIVVHPGKEESGYHTVVLKETLSEELYSLLHKADANNAMLRSFFIPVDKAAMRLDDFAKRFDTDSDGSMSDVFAKYADLNRRFRRKVILTIIMDMVLNEDAIPGRNFANNAKPMVYVNADPLLVLPNLDWVDMANRTKAEKPEKEKSPKEPKVVTPKKTPLTDEERNYLEDLERRSLIDEKPEEDNQQEDSQKKKANKKDAPLKMEKRYQEEIARYRALTEEENRKLAIIVAKGNQQAKDLMITGNMKLVLKVSKKYGSSEDYIAEGMVALMDAVSKYDPAREAFSTFATVLIKRRLSKIITSERYVPYTPDSKTEEIRKVSEANGSITFSVCLMVTGYVRHP